MTIYFISDGSHIKIGYTDGSPSTRLKSLQTGNPSALTLLGQHEGGTDVELGLHERFSDQRVHGEWFKPSSRLTEYIKTEASTGKAKRGKRQETIRHGQWLTLDNAMIQRLKDGDVSSSESAPSVPEWLDIAWANCDRPKGILLAAKEHINCDLVSSWVNPSKDAWEIEKDFAQEDPDFSRDGQVPFFSEELFPYFLSQPQGVDSYVLDPLEKTFGIKRAGLEYVGSNGWYSAYSRWFNMRFAHKELWVEFSSYCRKRVGGRFVTDEADAFYDFIHHFIRCAALVDAPFLRLSADDRVKYFSNSMLGHASQCKHRVEHLGMSGYVSRSGFAEGLMAWGRGNNLEPQCRFHREQDLFNANRMELRVTR
jgi:hypothetical protein